MTVTKAQITRFMKTGFLQCNSTVDAVGTNAIPPFP